MMIASSRYSLRVLLSALSLGTLFAALPAAYAKDGNSLASYSFFNQSLLDDPATDSTASPDATFAAAGTSHFSTIGLLGLGAAGFAWKAFGWHSTASDTPTITQSPTTDGAVASGKTPSSTPSGVSGDKDAYDSISSTIVTSPAVGGAYGSLSGGVRGTVGSPIAAPGISPVATQSGATTTVPTPVAANTATLAAPDRFISNIFTNNLPEITSGALSPSNTIAAFPADAVPEPGGTLFLGGMILCGTGSALRRHLR